MLRGEAFGGWVGGGWWRRRVAGRSTVATEGVGNNPLQLSVD